MSKAEKGVWQPKLRALEEGESRALAERGIPEEAPLRYAGGDIVSTADLRTIFADRIRYAEQVLGQSAGSLTDGAVRSIIDTHFTADSTPAGLRVKLVRLAEDETFRGADGTRRANRLMDAAVCGIEAKVKMTPEMRTAWVEAVKFTHSDVVGGNDAYTKAVNAARDRGDIEAIREIIATVAI